MLGWIPLLGPILQGISSIFNGWFTAKVQLKQAEVQENIAVTQTSAQIIATTNDDILLRILRDAAILPVVVWSMLIGWDTIIANRFPEYMFHVAGYPLSVAYLPYVVLVFLFGNIGLNMWRGK
jgi:hypothetical protein